MTPNIDNEYMNGYLQYIEDFMSKLTDVIDRALEIGNVIIARLQIDSFFSPKIYIEAASVGYEMNLSHEVAIAFLVIADGMRFESCSRDISTLSPSMRKRHSEYVKLARFVDFAIEPYANSDIPNKFMQRLVEGLSRRA